MSDQYNIIILPEAQEDIEKIVLYIAKQYFDPLKALELQNVIKEKIDSLSEFPNRGTPYEESPWEGKGVRWVVVKNYYIYYHVSDPEKAVRILSVIYVGRDQQKQMTRRYKN